MKDLSCQIIEDLIPLVKDGVASQASMDLLKDHLKDCQSCRSQMENIKDFIEGEEELKDREIISNIKKKLVIGQIGILVFGTVLGVALTFTMGMFYNLTLMPLLGALAYIFLRDRWYMVVVAIGLGSYSWQIGQSILESYFSWTIVYGALTMSLIYVGLSLLGSLIGFLLKFAFGKGDVDYEK